MEATRNGSRKCMEPRAALSTVEICWNGDLRNQELQTEEVDNAGWWQNALAAKVDWWQSILFGDWKGNNVDRHGSIVQHHGQKMAVGCKWAMLIADQ